MFIVMGGTGHLGSAVARALQDGGYAVAIVTRDASAIADVDAAGFEVIEADVDDVDALRATFRRGHRAFLLNPPADPRGDTDEVERRSVSHILAALEGSGLEKVVAASTYGAQPGRRVGDLSVLWEFEHALTRLSLPVGINRGAYYMSNWDMALETARDHGILPTMLPVDLAIPMVAPEDLGVAAAARLLSSRDDIGLQYVEGPERYRVVDVAEAFAEALGRSVEVQVTPRDAWDATFRDLGFSPEAAESYTRMTAATVDQGFDDPGRALHGTTTLRDYIRALVSGSA